jgi:hypothetical protein
VKPTACTSFPASKQMRCLAFPRTICRSILLIWFASFIGLNHRKSHGTFNWNLGFTFDRAAVFGAAIKGISCRNHKGYIPFLNFAHRPCRYYWMQ